jgi:hypothetical protein
MLKMRASEWTSGFRRKTALSVQAYANIPLKPARPISHNATGHPFLQNG